MAQRYHAASRADEVKDAAASGDGDADGSAIRL
jgi:hypothetical protein